MNFALYSPYGPAHYCQQHMKKVVKSEKKWVENHVKKSTVFLSAMASCVKFMEKICQFYVLKTRMTHFNQFIVGRSYSTAQVTAPDATV